MNEESFIYSFVARGTIVLCEYTEFTGNFAAIASHCLHKLPSSNNNNFTYICDHHTFIFILQDCYAYCVVAKECVSKHISIAFLERVKADFNIRYGGGKADTASAKSLNKEFGPVMKEHMKYIINHAEEIEKLIQVKAQVSEVKSIMLENIDKALDRGENLTILAHKTETLHSEVDTAHANEVVNCVDEQAGEQSLGQEISDVFGDPELFPRVGKEYQVEIPHLIYESGYSWFQNNLHQAESTVSTVHKFRVGLPIPIIWIKDEVENRKLESLKYASKSTEVTNKIDSSNLECTKETNVNRESKIERHEKHRKKSHFMVPGSASDNWNEIEEASFILGLYIFGKNLIQVRRFVGNKNMGDILSFYYGKFYKSDRYQRWSGCRKVKSRKCIHGQKIFTGPRQQELLSRLQPNASEECRDKLLELSKTFVEGEIHLEEYVLTLKDLVGLEALVEAVGVGKGKKDLTGLAVDSVKSTQAPPVRSEIPLGKACSMLTPAEIVKFLTGGFRLSKARTSDLFWEAVWPRLLARGWHSEQPCSYNYAIAAKHSLVFLIPGVKKFSRKLVKGNHYFDSVSDVLGKVASDPELIELETVADNDCTTKEGNVMDRENSPDQQRHCYLKVKTPTRSIDVMEFTVVDTSLASEKTTKVRELRSLPAGVLKASTYVSDSDGSDTSEEEANESESVNTVCFERGKTDISKASKLNIDRGISSFFNGLENNPSKEEITMSSMGSSSLPTSSKHQKTDLLTNTQKRDSLKCQLLQGMVSDNKNDIVPVTKRRRRSTTRSRAKQISDTVKIFAVPRVKVEEASFFHNNSKSSENVTANFFVAPRVKQEKANYCTGNAEFSGNALTLEIPPPKNDTLLEPQSISSSIISRKSVDVTGSSGTKDHGEKPQLRPMIDLNLPVLPEVGAEEAFVSEILQNNTSKELDECSVGTICKPVDDSDNQLDMNTRRRSRRNRPPTTKVLEAYASGYLDIKEKKRSRDYLQDSLIPRPSQCTYRKVEGSRGGDGAGFKKEEGSNGVCIGNSNGLEV
ncbi:putative transcription factor MYB/SANT family [Lupinus albus]|uniref:Putative transcription factor MYB/SANT family n=1 Tax=Lupinus albus TaxID=3870 RepID=A0A6A4Q6X4_LUPAL|nr:putative transcription factor MYB/SANT family [Lupinus albus]